jgi:hypothetical protein
VTRRSIHANREHGGQPKTPTHWLHEASLRGQNIWIEGSLHNTDEPTTAADPICRNPGRHRLDGLCYATDIQDRC